MGYTAFSRDRDYAGNVARSPGFDATYTLFQSPSLMNVSGKPVKAAWRAFLRELTPEEQERALLVILHDELEKPLGKIKVKKTGGVAGHNGLTSIVSSLGTKVRATCRYGEWSGTDDSRTSTASASASAGR